MKPQTPLTVIDMLNSKLETERAQHRYNLAELEKEKALLLHDLLEAKAELARRADRDALERSETASPATH